jgi:hypothetical protein
MEMWSYVQSEVWEIVAATIFWGVMVGPDRNRRGALTPDTSSFT